MCNGAMGLCSEYIRGIKGRIKMFKVGKPSDKPESPTYFWLEHDTGDAVVMWAMRDGAKVKVLHVSPRGLCVYAGADNMGFATGIGGRISLTK